MSAAIDIARFLLDLAGEGDENESQPLTNMHIQKLLYLAQGWHLALYGRPLFSDPIEAWRYGPVVRSVYDQYSGAGRGPVQDTEPCTALDEPTASLVRQVWQRYRTRSAVGLAEITHRHRPWKEAWSRRSNPDRACAEINQDSIERFFRGALKEVQGALSAEAVDLSDREFAAGNYTTLSELKAEFLPA